MRKLYTSTICVLLLLAQSPIVKAQTTIDFESETVSYQNFPNVNPFSKTYNGYTFTATGPQTGFYIGIEKDNPAVFATSIGYNSKYLYIATLDGSNITSFYITRQDGGLFNFNSIDLAPYPNSYPYDAPFDIYIQGFKNGVAVTSKITKSTEIKGYGGYVPKVTFDESTDASFKGIDKLQISLSTNTDYYALDNLIAESILSTPVHIYNFTGTINSSNLSTISWESGTENNLNYYELQKSNDAIHFEKIALIMAKGDRQKYTANVIQTSNNAYYRIKIVNKDNTDNYSNTIQLVSTLNSNIKMYPNPANETMHITVNKKIAATIYNSAGALVQKISLQKGENTLSIQSYAAGVYFVIMDDKKYSFIKK